MRAPAVLCMFARRNRRGGPVRKRGAGFNRKDRYVCRGYRLFKPELVFFDFDATDREDFFTEARRRAFSSRGYIKDTWFDAIMERENNYPTGLGCQAINVAIPHTTPSTSPSLTSPSSSPKNPVVFEPMGGMGDPVPAELIVNLGLLAHAEGQVSVLQALMGIFMDEGCLRRGHGTGHARVHG